MTQIQTTGFIPEFPSVFDSSMIALWKNCPKLFWFTHIQQFKPKELSIHLHAGKSFAAGVESAREAFYVNAQSAEDSVAIGLSRLIAEYGDFHCPPESAKSLERMSGALEFYFERYPLSHSEYPPVVLASGKRGIEFSFAHPLDLRHPETGDPIIYCGRMDALLQLNSSEPAVYITDEKTTSSLGQSWGAQWDLRSQFTGYAWGCGVSGIRADGVIVRGVSILKTKYDTQQHISYRPEWQIERWHTELHYWIRQIIDAWKSNMWLHNLDSACGDYGGCGFKTPCSVEDQESWLSTYFERRKWDPILRQELPVVA
jgi:hypothetical protein